MRLLLDDNLSLAVVVLRAKTNRLVDLRPLVPQLLRVLPLLQPGDIRWVEGEAAGVHSDMIMARAVKRLVICVKNDGYDVSLERRKLYVSIADSGAEKLGQLRVVDESGGDYLFPRELFVPIELPLSVR